MYGLTNLPKFFDLEKAPSYVEDNENMPSCIKELALFPTKHYKAFFITQDIQKSGKYTLVVNIDGMLEVISVDDRIPVSKKTLEPVWGLGYGNPWELILLKAWAKVKRGYHKVKKASPF